MASGSVRGALRWARNRRDPAAVQVRSSAPTKLWAAFGRPLAAGAVSVAEAGSELAAITGVDSGAVDQPGKTQTTLIVTYKFNATTCCSETKDNQERYLAKAVSVPTCVERPRRVSSVASSATVAPLCHCHRHQRHHELLKTQLKFDPRALALVRPTWP